MMNLKAVRNALAEQTKRRSTIILPNSALTMNDDGRLAVEGEYLSLSEVAREALAGRAQVPREFFLRCPGDMQAYLFNRLYPSSVDENDPDGSVGLILQDGVTIEAVCDPHLAILSAEDVLESALSCRPPSIVEKDLKVSAYQLNGVFRLSLVSDAFHAQPHVGDIVHAGIDILHSNTGAFATQIESYLLRLACRNGLLLKVCRHSLRGPQRIRRAAAGNERLTRRRVEEMSRRAWLELDAKMAAVNALASESVDNVAAIIRAICERLRFPDRLVNEVLQALNQDEYGATNTLWDVVGAFSRLGTHSRALSENTRRYLRELSGELISERVHQCPTCGRVRRGSLRLLPRR